MPRPPYTKRCRTGSRSIAISTGRNAAVPSGSTRPWMEQGTPSRNGSTRTRSQRGAKKANAAAASRSSVTHRTKFPPPLKPPRASPDQTEPSGPATSEAAAARVARSTGTMRDGAAGTAAACHTSSARSLSSSAMNAAGRPPRTGRPAIGSSLVTNGVADHTPRRAGSKASIAASANGGRVRNSRSWVRSSSVTDAVAGAGISTTTASSGAGTSPAPRIVHTTSTGHPSRRSHRTVPVAPARAPTASSTGRPAYTSASRAVTGSRTLGSARSTTPLTWAGGPCVSTAASHGGPPAPARRATPAR